MIIAALWFRYHSARQKKSIPNSNFLLLFWIKCIILYNECAGVMELVDVVDSKSTGCEIVAFEKAVVYQPLFKYNEIYLINIPPAYPS